MDGVVLVLLSSMTSAGRESIMARHQAYKFLIRQNCFKIKTQI